MCRWRRSQLSFLGVLLGTMSRHQGLASPAPDQPAPVKARATRARLRRLAALTGTGWPGVCRPCADGSARAICRSWQGLAVNKLAPFSGLSLLSREAPWLIKNLDRDERGHWDRCPTTSTTICGQQFDEGAARQRRNGLSGP
jgi:hypothetical protein